MISQFRQLGGFISLEGEMDVSGAHPSQVFLDWQTLKTEAGLKFNYPPRKNAKRLTESHVVNACTVALRLKRREISYVENVEEVEAKIKVGCFT